VSCAVGISSLNNLQTHVQTLHFQNCWVRAESAFQLSVHYVLGECKDNMKQVHFETLKWYRSNENELVLMSQPYIYKSGT